jgi:hypothetical protein
MLDNKDSKMEHHGHDSDSNVSVAEKIALENKIIEKIKGEVESENQVECKGRGPGGGHSKTKPGGGGHGRMRVENLLV